MDNRWVVLSFIAQFYGLGFMLGGLFLVIFAGSLVPSILFGLERLFRAFGVMSMGLGALMFFGLKRKKFRANDSNFLVKFVPKRWLGLF